MPQPMFSLLTASYNAAKYLDDWAASILAQRYRPLEVVFVDDASTDKTRKNIDRLAPAFADAGITLRAIRNEQQLHCASAYLEALRHATGEYFGVLDADDMLVDDAVEFIMRIYDEHASAGWAYTQFEWYNSRWKPLKKGFKCQAPPAGESLLSMGLKTVHTYSHWRTFSRRAGDLESIFEPGAKSNVDKYMGYRLEELSPGVFVDRVCYKYRLGIKKSITKSEATHKGDAWRRVMAEAQRRREAEGLEPHPITEVDAT